MGCEEWSVLVCGVALIAELPEIFAASENFAQDQVGGKDIPVNCIHPIDPEPSHAVLLCVIMIIVCAYDVRNPSHPEHLLCLPTTVNLLNTS